MRINFGELHISEISKQKINDCLNRNWVTEGKYTKEFEDIVYIADKLKEFERNV